MSGTHTVSKVATLSSAALLLVMCTSGEALAKTGEWCGTGKQRLLPKDLWERACDPFGLAVVATLLTLGLVGLAAWLLRSKS